MRQEKILVISFSQSGQLHEIMDSLLAPLRENSAIAVVDVALRPVTPFPFPWSLYQFLDVFPESFRALPCPLEPLQLDLHQEFDFVILAYQVWYLAPSIPVSSFLQSAEARRLLRNKPVLTVVACRNMWYRAHQMMKEHVRAADARLVGHIAFTDKAANIVSVITLLYWMLSGQKQRPLWLFPKPGISDEDIRRCSALAPIVTQVVLDPIIADIQPRLNQANACRVAPHLLLLEGAASRAFHVWSGLILRRGRDGNPSRRVLASAFGIWLACGIAFLSPLSFLVFHLTYPFRRRAVQHQVEQVYRY
jgi:hypothetical protein